MQVVELEMDLPDLADLDFADLDLFDVVSVESAPEFLRLPPGDHRTRACIS